MLSKRIQLTLFVPNEDAIVIEKIRGQFNPVQQQLIKAHITLCREDELIAVETVLKNIQSLAIKTITLGFGTPIRFDDGKGILLPATEGLDNFHTLRIQVLQGIIEQPRVQAPHITLLHPRNATCTDAIFEQILETEFPSKIKFSNISLIEQIDGKEWNVLKEFNL
jgi:2'-5' RNA ligase